MASEADPRPPGHYLCWCGTVVSPGRVPGAVLYETDGERHKCPLPRATERHQDHPGGDRGTEPDASPGGVRVVWTEEAKREVMRGVRHTKLSIPELAESALPHLRVEVDPQTREQLALVCDDPAYVLEILGIHLSDGGSDG